MPTIDQTVTTPYWPLKTEEQLEVASRELLTAWGKMNRIDRFVDQFNIPRVQLSVMQASQWTAYDVGAGTLVLEPNGSYSILSDDECAVRGIPVDHTPGS